MITATLAEVQKRFGFFRTKAHAEPVVMTSHGVNDLVMLSYDEFTKLKQRSRTAIRSTDLGEDDLKIIEAARAPAESMEFNDEVQS